MANTNALIRSNQRPSLTPTASCFHEAWMPFEPNTVFSQTHRWNLIHYICRQLMNKLFGRGNSGEALIPFPSTPSSSTLLNSLYLPWWTEIERPLCALEDINVYSKPPKFNSFAWNHFKSSHNFSFHQKINYKNTSNEFQTSSTFQKTTNKIMSILSKHSLALPLLLIAAASNFNPVASAGTAFESKADLHTAVNSYCGGTFNASVSSYGWVFVPDHRPSCWLFVFDAPRSTEIDR